MSRRYEDETVYCDNYIKLSQLNVGLQSVKFTQHTAVIDGILQSGGAINYAIPLNSLVSLHRPEWLGYTALHFAVQQDNYFGVKLLLSHGADFTIKNNNGCTALHMAIEDVVSKNLKGKLKRPIIDLILDHLRSVNYANPCCNNGMSHFHIACMTNDRRISELFLKNGTSVHSAINTDSPNLSGYTPLHLAARYSCFETVELLLQYGAEVNAKDSKGWTPLNLILERTIEVIDTIKTAKPRPYSKFQSELAADEKILDILLKSNSANSLNATDSMGLSYLHVACTRNDKSIVENLLQQGADVNATVNLNSPLLPGYTPLHFAAHFNIEIVKLLLTAGANINARNAKGVTPLDLCVERYVLEDIFVILSIALRNTISNNTRLFDIISYTMSNSKSLQHFFLTDFADANTSLPADSPVWPGYNLLHIAVTLAKRVKEETFYVDNDYSSEDEYFNDSEPDVNADDSSTGQEDEFANNPNCNFDTACDRRVNTLLHYGANFTAQDVNGSTPLHLALRMTKNNIVHIILHYHNWWSANPIDKENLSHFHIACMSRKMILVEGFLRNGIDIDGSIKTALKYETNEPRNVTFAAGSTALHMLVVLRYKELVELLLSHGANVFIKDADGSTPIHHTIEFRKYPHNIVNLLLAAPGVKDKNSVNNLGLSHFHIACSANNLVIVQALLHHGVDVNSPVSFEANNAYSGYTPLHFAVERYSSTVVELLLNCGADIHAKNKEGLTPFHKALKNGADCGERIVNAFLPLLREDNASRIVDETGLSLLHVACARLSGDAVADLLQSGYDVNARIGGDSPIWSGFTPLHVVVERIDEDYPTNGTEKVERIVEILVQFGADVTLKNSKNLTPLQAAYAVNLYRKPESILDLLLRSHAIVQANPVDNEGMSHFHVACTREDPTIVEGFLSRGVSANCPNDYFADNGGYSPLHFAARHKRKAIVEVLLRHGADPNARNSDGDTPLHVACADSNTAEIIETLLSIGKADPNPTNIFGETPLELSLRRTRPQLPEIEVLLRLGARVNFVNPVSSCPLLGLAFTSKLGYEDNIVAVVSWAHDLLERREEDGRASALHNLCQAREARRTAREFAEVIECLLVRGCELDWRDTRGRTALHVALAADNPRAVEGLLMCGADVDLVDHAGWSVLAEVVAAREARGLGPPATDCFALLYDHVHKSLVTGVRVTPENRRWHMRAREIFGQPDGRWMEGYLEELGRMEEVGAGGHSTLRDALVRMAPLTERRRCILEETFLKSDFHLRFPELGGLLKLQYRRTLARMKLLEPAKHALEVSLSLGLPDPCSEAILSYLSDDELNKLLGLD